MLGVTFPGDPTTYVVPTLVEMDSLGFRLAREARASRIPLECTVVISNGALPYSLAVHNHLGNRGKIITIGTLIYKRRSLFRPDFAGSPHLDEQVDCYLAGLAAQPEVGLPGPTGPGQR